MVLERWKKDMQEVTGFGGMEVVMGTCWEQFQSDGDRSKLKREWKVRE